MEKIRDESAYYGVGWQLDRPNLMGLRGKKPVRRSTTVFGLAKI